MAQPRACPGHGVQHVSGPCDTVCLLSPFLLDVTSGKTNTSDEGLLVPSLTHRTMRAAAAQLWAHVSSQPNRTHRWDRLPPRSKGLGKLARMASVFPTWLQCPWTKQVDGPASRGGGAWTPPTSLGWHCLHQAHGCFACRSGTLCNIASRKQIFMLVNIIKI